MDANLKHSEQPEKAPLTGVGSGNGMVLFLIGVLTVVACWGVHRNAIVNKTTATAMNIVGKQRMLIQRVYMLCGEITLRKDDGNLNPLRENLFATARQMEQSHGLIINGGTELGWPGAPPPAVVGMLYEEPLRLDGRMRRYASAAKEFSAGPENELTRENPLFKLIEKEGGLEGNLLGDWDAVAGQYQKDGDAEAKKTEMAETSLLGGILALLSAYGLFVFRPMARRLRDETRRKETEKEEERIRFFNLPLDMMCVAGTDGYFKNVNQAFIKTLGYSERELLERQFVELIHPDDRQPTLKEVEKLLKGGVTQDFENRYKCKDGTYLWFSWKGVAVLDEGCLYATVRDVTERKRIEESNRLKTEYLELLREITSQCNEARTTNEVLQVFADKICAHIG